MYLQHWLIPWTIPVNVVLIGWHTTRSSAGKTVLLRQTRSSGWPCTHRILTCWAVAQSEVHGCASAAHWWLIGFLHCPSLIAACALTTRQCEYIHVAVGIYAAVARFVRPTILPLWNAQGLRCFCTILLLLMYQTYPAFYRQHGSIARSATRRYLIYSDADFEVFRPAGTTTLHRLGWNLAWRRGTRSPPPCQISPQSAFGDWMFAILPHMVWR